MRFIPTRIHGMLDYLVGLLLIAAPFVLDFAEDSGPEMWVPIIVGAGIILLSLITDYELSIANIIPMSFHLLMDALAGIVLIASPWLFGFSDDVWLPHVIVGALEIGAALMTHTVPDHEVENGRRMDRA